jgi:hypothetical protein
MTPLLTLECKNLTPEDLFSCVIISPFILLYGHKHCSTEVEFSGHSGSTDSST